VSSPPQGRPTATKSKISSSAESSLVEVVPAGPTHASSSQEVREVSREAKGSTARGRSERHAGGSGSSHSLSRREREARPVVFTTTRKKLSRKVTPKRSASTETLDLYLCRKEVVFSLLRLTNYVRFFQHAYVSATKEWCRRLLPLSFQWFRWKAGCSPLLIVACEPPILCDEANVMPHLFDRLPSADEWANSGTV